MRMDRITPDRELDPAWVQPGQEWVFDPLDWHDKYGPKGMTLVEAEKAAMAERNATKQKLIRLGFNARGTSLRGQLKPYKSFGVSDGRVRTVFYLFILEPKE